MLHQVLFYLRYRVTQPWIRISFPTQTRTQLLDLNDRLWIESVTSPIGDIVTSRERRLKIILTSTQRPGSRLQREFSVLILCVNSPSIRTFSDAPALVATRTPPDWRLTDTCVHKENESELMPRSNNSSMLRSLLGGGVQLIPLRDGEMS